ncbi:hypothetical protein COB21_04790 [Candidatus Aerophobetes bacterium]|uniref:Uncharacterized protein n=1 Tax=Aerophobetes bacterium TaxID=2030807 RepID=A0A2A4X0Y3_UNCAE|nr:MAG: hypothetical protein COB21_04790 [Candidatus Aerophobetes bacterium]
MSVNNVTNNHGVAEATPQVPAKEVLNLGKAIVEVAKQALSWNKTAGSIKASAQKQSNFSNSKVGSFLNRFATVSKAVEQGAHEKVLDSLKGDNKKDLENLMATGYDLTKSSMGEDGCKLTKSSGHTAKAARAVLNKHGLSRSSIEAKVNANDSNSALSQFAKDSGIE